MGPEIEISFDEVPGIQAGKTPLVYRGVDAGMVTAVELDKNLNKVLVKVRLKKFAAALASEETDFWVEKPVITLAELTGLESIIQGNSIRARNPGGDSATHFVGLPEPPLMPLLPGAFTIRLKGAQIPFLNRGTPVYHRGVKVGLVREKLIDENGMPELHQLTPTLTVLQKKGFKVALVTDGRMSGASGKVPAAIHLTPEAHEGGNIAKIQTGDILRLDATKGELTCLTPQFQVREVRVKDNFAIHYGRELFSNARKIVTSSEEGASFLL
jgi:hypothetical protein